MGVCHKQIEIRWESESGREKEEDTRLVKQILMRYRERKLSSLVLNLCCQAVRFSVRSAYLVSTSWAKLSSWCAQMSHQGSLLPVRRDVAEHCASCTPAPLWQLQQAGLRPLGQDPRSCSMEVSCTHGQDCQEPPEDYCSRSRRIRRHGKEGRKKEADRLKWKRETETNVDNIKKHVLDLANKSISIWVEASFN